MNSVRQLVLLIAISQYLTQVFAVTKVNSVSCDYNPRKCTQGYCNMLSPRGSMRYISVGCNVLKPLDKLWINMKLLRQTGDKYVTLVKVFEINLCNFINAKTENYVFSRLISLTAQKVGIECPLKGNVSFSRIPCYMHFMQGFYPVGQYVFYGHVHQRPEYIVTINLTFAIKENDFF